MNIYSEKPEQVETTPFWEKNNFVSDLLLRYKKYGTIIIAVDYDNTIYDYSQKGVDFSEVHSLLRRASDIGCKIVIYTARNKRDFYKIYEYCNDISLKVDAINEDVIDIDPPTSGKIYYNIILDDKGGLLEAIDVLKSTLDLIEKEKPKEESVINPNIIREMVANNTQEYNILKALEEMSELSMELTKFLTKKNEFKPPLSKLHEETSHVTIRMAVLREMFGAEETDIEQNKKLGQIANRISQKKQNNL